ncbi:hypothetical protein KOM00_06365 [Geomonas sp. Red69]|uniref:Uncharacterized protein n=1 Tax=Geomonas diazotrophica TaxID=2843197 RepID=A0ABX8JN49_9BACT|nr:MULTISPECIES: hypothetical protein [Geomonas]MBU5636355.1 hypothetical protein [Geomonas diazotrophica]QWV99148.1 hypothetical protein KP005_07685 [Geomonas nitrogeniifigens]QXE88316.1 hypothetical protein KP003_07940 [Geomonas nitrogeniifigens]
MRTPKLTIFAKQTGVEIAPSEKRQNGKPEEGRVAFRFFRLASGQPHIRFVAEPCEAFEVSRKITQLQASGGKATFTHRFESAEGESVTKLNVESYQRNGKQGYAFSIQRGEESINVPAPEGEFLFAAEFLRQLSVAQSWVAWTEPEAPKRD